MNTETSAWIDVYPNPTMGSIELTSNVSMDEYVLCDSYGRLKLSSSMKESKNHTLDIDIYISESCLG